MRDKTPNVVHFPYSLLNISIAVIITVLALGVAPAYIYFYGVSTLTIGLAIAYYLLSGFAITAGYHRLFSHRAYQAHWTYRLFMAIWGAAAVQNSILEWCRHHRIHHKYVDDVNKDPYPITRGLFYAHVGWLLRNHNWDAQMPKVNLKDLERDWVVRFQHRFYWQLVMLMNIAIPVGIGFMVGKPLEMFLVVTVLRLFIVENVIFMTNSLSHFWGRQPFTNDNTARDNHLLSVFLLGEGYHNYHHRFEYDYRNGIHWYDFDPTKWLISGLSKLGMTYGLKTASVAQINNAISRMQIHRAERKLSHIPTWEDARQALETKREAMIAKLRDIEELKEEKQRLAKARYAKTHLRMVALSQTIKERKQQWKEARQHFKKQLGDTLRSLPQAA